MNLFHACEYNFIVVLTRVNDVLHAALLHLNVETREVALVVARKIVVDLTGLETFFFIYFVKKNRKYKVVYIIPTFNIWRRFLLVFYTGKYCKRVKTKPAKTTTF